MEKPTHYIVVDDDVTNNLICEYNIKNFDKDAKVRLFTQPELALESIKEHKFSDGANTVLFLDLNMPTMTGWEFLEKFSYLPSEFRKDISIYILTSAIEENGIETFDYDFLRGFLSKPLSKTYLEKVAASFKNKA